ncbi:MAG TPA: hypothetical protein VG898_07015 [Solirubrobacterales bacterium]|nr:hypothetical protein [Solirubrobacterales bacterium]
MRLSTATVGMLLGLSLLLGGCGEDRTTAAGPASTVAAAEDGSAGASAGPGPSTGRSCRRELGPFAAALASLRDDLARGLDYDAYLQRVQSTRAAYARIHPGRIPVACLLESGDAAEEALNLYIDAANAWGDCLATVSCSTRSIEPRLQRKWGLAEGRIAVAQQGLRSAPSG